ncbi:MAG: zinc ABC transporter substrate-binding protein ZnuA [Alphaproteobacteria bacterium]|nr:zinc ABC transporter substrate-binding protein ZnuA [Alphaproteobacteria bacterium]
MRFISTAFLATTILMSNATLANADLKVVASIKPVHSLVTAVMEGVGKPELLVEGAGSPHTYSLKPSQANKLQKADIVFWMSHDLEAFLENSIESIAKNAKAVSLMDAHDLIKLNFREGGAFDAHGHDDHKDHDEHGHDDHKDHGHKDHDDHGHHGTDPHVWLDPVNAKAMIHEIEAALIEADPANASAYEANAKAMMSKLDNLVAEIDAELQPVKGRGYVVFHDAYQYFENRFGVSAVGSITVSPEVLPGAERVAELREKVRDLDATCVFSEPQFQPKLVKTITENTNAGTGVLDPLGASIDDGAELYFTLIRNMAASLKKCLLK